MIHNAEISRNSADEPHLCASHTIAIMDESGSKRKADVDCYRLRLHALFCSPALERVAEQLCNTTALGEEIESTICL